VASRVVKVFREGHTLGAHPRSLPSGRRMSMEPASVRVAVLLLVGVLVAILALYAPEAGAAVVGAATVVALLAELTARK
jgi:hypothetical protein